MDLCWFDSGEVGEETSEGAEDFFVLAFKTASGLVQLDLAHLIRGGGTIQAWFRLPQK